MPAKVPGSVPENRSRVWPRAGPALTYTISENANNERAEPQKPRTQPSKYHRFLRPVIGNTQLGSRKLRRNASLPTGAGAAGEDRITLLFDRISLFLLDSPSVKY